MKNILVTGGAGYIGSHTCKLLKQSGYNPIVFDNLSTGSVNAVKWGEFVKGDIRDFQSISKVIKDYKIDAVVHFAAKLSVEESVHNPLVYYDNNVNGTLVLLKAMIENNIKNIVFSSSASVYGIPEKNEPIKEDAQLKPINPYGNTKKIMEEMLEDCSKSYLYM